MNTVIYLEKKAQADDVLRSFARQERHPFHYELAVSEQFPNGARAVWCPTVYLYGVLIELLKMKKEQAEKANQQVKMYEGSALPALLELERPLNEQDLEQAFGAYFKEEWMTAITQTLNAFKEADTIIFYANDTASQTNFRLLYELAQSNATIVPYTVHSHSKETIDKGWADLSEAKEGFVARWDESESNVYQTIFRFLKQKTCS